MSGYFSMLAGLVQFHRSDPKRVVRLTTAPAPWDWYPVDDRSIAGGCMGAADVFHAVPPDEDLECAHHDDLVAMDTKPMGGEFGYRIERIIFLQIRCLVLNNFLKHD